MNDGAKDYKVIMKVINVAEESQSYWERDLFNVIIREIGINKK